MPSLVSFIDVLSSMASGESQTILIASALRTGEPVELALTSTSEEGPGVVAEVQRESRYRWSGSAESWRTAADLLLPFVELGVTGHQYLTDRPSPIVVEVTFGERT
jgi:hypothetical protein